VQKIIETIDTQRVRNIDHVVTRKKPAIIRGLTTSLGLSALALCAACESQINEASLSDEEIFVARDVDQNGILSAEELAPEAETLMLIMGDEDGIERDEFISKGRIGYVLSGEMTDPEEFNKPRDENSAYLVEFKIGPKRMDVSRTSMLGRIEENLNYIVFDNKGGGRLIADGPAGIDYRNGFSAGTMQ